jgi:hypothetical protein
VRRLSQSEIRVPIKKTMYVLGIIFCALATAITFFVSFTIDLQGENVDVHSRGKAAWFQLLFMFIPANLFLLLIGILSAMVAYFLFKKINKKDAIIINSRGIIINVSIVKTGLIPWNEIRDVEIVAYGNQKNLCINLVNPIPLIKQQKRSVRFLLFFNKLLGFNYPIAIPFTSIKMKLPELHRLIQQHHIHYRHIS